jgi:AcrR family transcriptional regulator
MSISTEQIIATCTRVFASVGYDGLSMRTFAKEMGCSLSNLYYYYPGKDELLRAMFDTVNTRLGKERSFLPKLEGTEALLKQRIQFQFTHAEEVVAILKYYMHYRHDFSQNEHGYLPAKAHLHIEEVLNWGVASGELQSTNISKDAKLIAHMINGFVLEYYPAIPQGDELEHLTSQLAAFAVRALHTTT